jgi:hypothetical protein
VEGRRGSRPPLAAVDPVPGGHTGRRMTVFPTRRRALADGPARVTRARSNFSHFLYRATQDPRQLPAGLVKGSAGCFWSASRTRLLASIDDSITNAHSETGAATARASAASGAHRGRTKKRRRTLMRPLESPGSLRVPRRAGWAFQIRYSYSHVNALIRELGLRDRVLSNRSPARNEERPGPMERGGVHQSSQSDRLPGVRRGVNFV